MDQGKVGDFIAKLRKERNITQEELGNIVGVTGKAVSRWERGKGVPDISIINKVSDILGVTTTELLNGERVSGLGNQNIDEIIKNSIGFYRRAFNKKIRNLSFILISIILSLIALILTIFWINNYNKCRIYSIESTSSEVTLSGLLSITNKGNTFVINNFEYGGSNLMDIYDIEYKFMVDGEEIFSEGDISAYQYDKDSKSINIREYFKKTNFYISNFSKQKINKIINGKVIYIVFNYIGYNGARYDYSVPIKLDKQFSNSHLVYFH